MQHYFGEIVDNKVILSKEDLHHLLNVKRANIGEEIEVSCNGKLFSCLVSRINPVEITVVNEIIKSRELKNKITLAFSVLKSSSYNELIVQKGVELGVNEFIPMFSERVIVKGKKEEDNKLVRLKKISKEAAEQCRRNIIPEISIYQDYIDVLSKEYDYKLFAYEGDFGKSNTIYKALENLKEGQSILVVIGPEGGFSDKEIKLAKDNGCQFVSLGSRILRAETACLYSCAIISSICEEK